MVLSRTFLIIGCLLVAALPTQAQIAPPLPASTPAPSDFTINLDHLEASKVVQAVDRLQSFFPRATVLELDQNTLLIVPRQPQASISANDINRMREYVRSWDTTRSVEEARHGVLRLFHLRKAAEIAKAINAGQADNEPKLEAIGSDLLLIVGGDAREGGAGRRLEQFVALLDQPQPQITLELWSLQISDQSPAAIEEYFGGVRTVIEKYDAVLREIYIRTWRKLRELSRNASFFDARLHSYVTAKYPDCAYGSAYCLGYDVDLSSAPSFSRLLTTLAMSNQPLANAQAVLKAIWEPSAGGPSAKDGFLCPPLMEERTAEGTNPTVPCLSNTWREFQYLLSESDQLQAFRAAIADYLFHYKFSLSYPSYFIPYDLQRSADTLNSLFGPVIEAFNSDIQVFLDQMRAERAWPPVGKSAPVKSLLRKLFLNEEATLEGLSQSSNVRVVSLSAQKAEVTGRTVSFFDVTPPASFSDVTGAAVNAETGLLDFAPLTPARLITGLQALTRPEPVTAEVARGISLKVTPISLATASSAELDLEIIVGEPEDAPPKVVGESRSHTLSRVAEHKVLTKVRVPGARLFEVSAFALDVQHPRPDGLVPVVGHAWNGVFGGIPVLNGFFRWKREPVTVYHRSLVVASAIIVPTAADLALGIRFSRDREPTSAGLAYRARPPAGARDSHKQELERIRQ